MNYLIEFIECSYIRKGDMNYLLELIYVRI